MLLPGKIKSALEKNQLYLKFRFSTGMYKLWLLFRADVRKELLDKRSFYESVLPHNCNLIFDIGANEGSFTELFSNHSHMVIAVEPSQRNVSVLSARFRNRKDIIIVPKAVSHTTGYQHWFEDKTNYAMGTLSRKWNDSKVLKTGNATKIETVTIDDLIKESGMPDYIKIDVEGHEQQVLRGLTQPIPLLSFEAILPHFLEETIACIQQLLSLDPQLHFNYAVENKFVYNNYQVPEKLLHDIQYIRQTVDIFCKL